jgi:hypothetical protein
MSRQRIFPSSLPIAIRLPSGAKATARTPKPKLEKHRSCRPVFRFQRRTVPSMLADAIVSESADNAIAPIRPVCPSDWQSSFPVKTLHIRTAESSPAAATVLQSGEKVNSTIPVIWPFISCKHFSESNSNSRTTPAASPVARIFPFGEKARCWAQACPFKLLNNLPLSVAHKSTVVPPPHEARMSPLAENAKDSMGLSYCVIMRSTSLFSFKSQRAITFELTEKAICLPSGCTFRQNLTVMWRNRVDV